MQRNKFAPPQANSNVLICQTGSNRFRPNSESATETINAMQFIEYRKQRLLIRKQLQRVYPVKSVARGHEHSQRSIEFSNKQTKQTSRVISIYLL